MNAIQRTRKQLQSVRAAQRDLEKNWKLEIRQATICYELKLKQLFKRDSDLWKRLQKLESCASQATDQSEDK